MDDILSFVLEPVAYLICAAFILLHSIRIRQLKYFILIAYYFIATLLIARANLFREVNNIEIYNVLNLITFVFLGAYYYLTIITAWRRKVILAMAVGGGLYYAGTKILVSDSILLFDSTGQVLLSIAMLTMVSFFLQQLWINVNEEPLSMNFDFWFSSAQLTYYVASFLIFLTYRYLTKKVIDGNYLYEDRKLLTELWAVHNVILFLSSSIIAGSTLWIRYRSKSASS
ncbi:MAG: hypothetical protein JSU09_16350 [Bacteroidetes bacterium]|nr:hypothetical protein [Bacteroidota bacterium]